LAEVFSQAGGRFLSAVSGNYAAGANRTDSVIEGGGGYFRYFRGAFGGTAVQGGVEFQNVDGGAGGLARIGVRYSIGYGNSSATLRVNGVDHAFPLRRHFPDYGWMAAGWNWDFVDVTLQPGTTNTVEVLPSTTSNFALNGIRVSHASDLAGFERHGRVAVLPQAERDELFAYLRQVDGRDAAGVPLNWGPVHASAQPQVLENPAGAVIAQGNTHRMQAVVAGRGPFSFQWLKDGAEIPGATLQELVLANAAPAQAGNYTVRVSSDSGTVVSFAAELVVEAPLEFVSSSLAEGRVNRSYEQVLAATGGLGNRTWSLVEGVLPPGMEFLANGTLRGTPTAPAREELTFRVADSSGTVERSLLLEIAPRGGFSTDPDLILHYTFDEGAGSRIWDIARAGNDHSTTVPGVFWAGSGRFDRSFASGGTDNVVKRFFPENQSDLNFDPRSDEFTVVVWVRSNTNTGWRAIFSKDTTGTGSIQYGLWMRGNSTSLQGHSATGHFNATLPAGTNLQGETWHQLALVNTRQSGVLWTRIYRDGQLLAERNPATTAPVSGMLSVGDSTQGGNGWAGGLDDFRVYKRALTVAELNALQQSPSSVDLGGLTLTYDGTPRSVVVETDPPGLAVAVTYNGSATPPTDAGNYTVQANVTETGYAGSASGILSVARKPLTVSGLSGVNKIFDGSLSASVTGTPVLHGVVPGDSVSLSGTPSYAFGNATVGAGKSIVASGFEISGPAAVNYALSQPSGLSASILAVPTPVLTPSVTSLPAFTASRGSPSSTALFFVSGSNLTANITVGAPESFELSSTGSGPFATILNLTATNGTVLSTGVYARLTANAPAGTRTGVITLSSAGADSQTVAVGGTVTLPYEDWTSSWNLTGSNAHSAADPDGDGHNNFAEFAFAGDPTAPNPSLISVVSGNGNMTVTFHARTANNTVWTNGSAQGHGVVYQIQGAHGLSSGFGTGGDVLNNGTVTPAENQTGVPSADVPYVRWSFDVPISGDRRFYRIQATTDQN